MNTLLRIVGAVWALLGVGNVVMMPWDIWSGTALSLGMIFNMVAFIIPGLALYALGDRKRDDA